MNECFPVRSISEAYLLPSAPSRPHQACPADTDGIDDINKLCQPPERPQGAGRGILQAWSKQCEHGTLEGMTH
eukprot:1138478-Pelagomonas_calceolata.AAC.5